MKYTYKAINAILDKSDNQTFFRSNGHGSYVKIEPHKVYTDILNQIQTLQINKVVFDNNAAHIDYENGKAFINYSNYPIPIKKMLLEYLQQFEDLI